MKNICSLVNFHIRHLFHIWGTIGTKLKEPNDPLQRQFEMLQNKQMEKLTFYICTLPFYKGLKINLKVKGPCRVQTLHIPRFKNPNVLHSLQLFLFREQPKCGAINGIGLDGWDVSPGGVRNRAPYGANKNTTEKVMEP